MKILITGATGFIGSHLAKKLIEKGYEVFAIVRHSPRAHSNLSGVKTVTGDLLDIHGLKKAVEYVQPEIVCHLGGITPVRYSFENPFIYAKINYIGTMNIVHASLFSHILQKFIHASTAEVYMTKETPLTENDILYGATPYGISKVAADHYVRVAGDSYGLPYLILRPSNTYGRKTEKGYFIEKIITTMLTSDKIYLDGTPDHTRDWLYVEDHVDGYVKAIESKVKNEVFNISTGKGTTLGKTVEIVRELVESNGDIAWGMNPRPSDPRYLILDNSKAKKILNWKPKYDIKNGLEKVIDFWREMV